MPGMGGSLSVVVVFFFKRRNKFLSDLESSFCLVLVIKDPWILQWPLGESLESIWKNPVYLFISQVIGSDPVFKEL